MDVRSVHSNPTEIANINRFYSFYIMTARH